MFIFFWNHFTRYISNSPDHPHKHNEDPGVSESSLCLVNVYRSFIDHFSIGVTCFLSLCSLFFVLCLTLKAQCSILPDPLHNRLFGERKKQVFIFMGNKFIKGRRTLGGGKLFSDSMHKPRCNFAD